MLPPLTDKAAGESWAFDYIRILEAQIAARSSSKPSGCTQRRHPLIVEYRRCLEGDALDAFLAVLGMWIAAAIAGKTLSHQELWAMVRRRSD